MTQYELINNKLILKVNKSPFLVRATMFVFAFLSFLMPIFGLLLSLSMGKGFHIGFIIGIGLFSLIGFYMLRISLWNTYGS